MKSSVSECLCIAFPNLGEKMEQRIYYKFSMLKIRGDAKEKKYQCYHNNGTKQNHQQFTTMNIWKSCVYSRASREAHILLFPTTFFLMKLVTPHLNKTKLNKKHTLLSPNDVVKMEYLLWKKPVLT